MLILADLKEVVKSHKSDIILIIAVVLVSLLSFAIGYIIAKYQEKESISIESFYEVSQEK